jgi:hypothetical protein
VSLQMLSDGQCVETSGISKIELFEETQNLLVTLKNGHLLGVHGNGVTKDAILLEYLGKKECLRYLVFWKNNPPNHQHKS